MPRNGGRSSRSCGSNRSERKAALGAYSAAAERGQVVMKRSDGRILTTHAGSLPRPRELTRLYALRANGQSIDEAAIDRAGREAVRATVRMQREAGIDIG